MKIKIHNILVLLILGALFTAPVMSNDPLYDPTPEIQTNTQTVSEEGDLSGRIYEIYTYQDQQSSPLEQQPYQNEIQDGISEYSISFWFKLDYLWKDEPKFNFDRLLNQQIELATLGEHKDMGWDTTNPGSRTLSLHVEYIEDSVQLLASTYNLGSNESNKDNIQKAVLLPAGETFDSKWTFVHFSYSTSEQKAILALKRENADWHTLVWENVVHNPITLTNKLYFRLGNTRDQHTAPGWNGQYRWVRFTHGQDGSGGFRNLDQTQQYFSTLQQPEITPVTHVTHLTLRTDGDTQVDRVSYIDQGFETSIYKAQYPKEYAIEGFFKVPADVELDHQYRLIYRVSTKNFATAGNENQLGAKTLQAEVNYNTIRFTTYNIHNINDIETQTTIKEYSITKDDYQNDIYIYHGYSLDAFQASCFIKTYDQENGQFSIQPSASNAITHMRSDDFIIHLAQDDDHSQGLQGDLSCWKFRQGAGSFFASSQEILAQIDNNCVREGEAPPGDGIYSLQSYNYPNLYMSHGNPSFLTDDKIGKFYFEEGLIGDPDTVSLRSAQVVNGEERTDFYWRHANSVIREMRNDNSDTFKKQSSFIIHKDKFIDGTIALESSNHRGYYIRHQNYVIRLARDDGTDLFKEDASWIFQPIVDVPEVQLDLVPIWRLFNSETGDTILTSSDERKAALVGQGYADSDQLYEDSDEAAQKLNIIGYGYTQNRDSHSAALIEFYNPDTRVHYYTTNPNDIPGDGFEFNSIICYVYPMLYERTIATHLFYRLTDPGTGLYHWVTSIYEKETSDPALYQYHTIQFYVVQTPDDPCLYDINRCGPVIPTPCETNHHYRQTQDSECVECQGELTHYDGQVVDLMYTATCTPCEGGYDQDENGVRTCRTCPNGQWVDVGLPDKACYPNCDFTQNKYLNKDTLECIDCSGELVPDENLDNVHTCKECEMGTDIEVLCQLELQKTPYYLPDTCPTDHTEVSRRQVCKICEFGPWTRNPDDGILYCIKVCENPNFYVDENNECKECVNGYIYDDGTGTKRCAENITAGPYHYSYDEDDTYTYEVPHDQLDDIKEYGFFLWVRHSYLNPKYFDFKSFRAHNARIGGFVIGNGLVAHYPFHGNANDVVSGLNGIVNGAQLTQNRFGTDNTAYLFDNNSIQLPHQILDGKTDFTVSVWLKRDVEHFLDNVRNIQVWLSGTHTGNNEINFSSYFQVIKEQQYMTDYREAVHGNWAQITYVRQTQSSELNVYVNGVLVNTITDVQTGALNIANGGLILGQDQDAIGGGFEAHEAYYGALSDLRFYDKALTQEEVESLYNYESENDYTGQGLKTDTSEGLQAYLGAHNNDDNQLENIIFEGIGNSQTSYAYPDRKDHDYSWNLIYCAQSNAGQAVGYTYYSHSQRSEVRVFDSQSKSELSNLNFYLGRRIGLNSYTSLGFQGTYYNIQLRFGQSDVFYNNQASIEAYLESQYMPINVLPPVQVYNGVKAPFPVNTEVDLSTLTPEEKTFRFEELHGTQEYAVFGWFKIEGQIGQFNQILFNLKDQPNRKTNTNWGLSQKVGDRALFTEYNLDKSFKFDTYSTSATTLGDSTIVQQRYSVPREEEDLQHWFWIYQAYSRVEKKTWVYVRQLIGGDDQYVIEDNVELWHFRPDQQVFQVGYYPNDNLDTSRFKSFNGKVWNLLVQYGNLCKPHEDACFERLYKPTPIPAPFGQCVILYNKENYTGEKFVSICDENESFSLDVKSIYIPEGVRFKLWDNPQFQGLTVSYSESFASIASIDFQLLLEGRVQGATIVQNERYEQFMAKQQRQEQIVQEEQDHIALKVANNKTRSHLRKNGHSKKK